MYIQVGGPDWGRLIPVFFAGMIGLLILLVVVYFLLKMKDNSKPLISKKVKILEKPIQQANIEWYVVECENGERLKLRSFQANHIIIAVGDIGIVEYRGKTIQSFRRQA